MAAFCASPLSPWLVKSSKFGSHNQRTTLVPRDCSSRSRSSIAGAVEGHGLAVAEKFEKKTTGNGKLCAKERRIVVTGLGLVTSLGDDPDVFYNNLLNGTCGISNIEKFDCSELPTRIAGEIKSFSAENWVSPKLVKRMDNFMIYMLIAGKKALSDGGITDEINGGLDKTRCGAIIGSTMGGLKVFHEGLIALEHSIKKVNPFSVPFQLANMGVAVLAMDLGWNGPTYCTSLSCATSNACILNAAHHIVNGEVDIMLCGGSDAAVHPIGLGGFGASRLLSRNNDPMKASRPWDAGRDGLVIGDGAGVLLLEELEHAKRRGARIYAEFLGGSFSSDAYHYTQPHPDGEGMRICIEKAVARCGVNKRDINYINAHAASTQVGDMREYQAIISCFSNNPELKVNSSKSMTGHLLGASGAIDAITTVKAIQTGWLHPNMNLDQPEKGLDTSLLVGSKKERLDVKVALSNAFGIGGQNSCIMFAPYK